MPEDQPSSVYRVQLSSLHRGYALWNPKPVKEIYDRISIGDVGYVNNKGIFHRMFNVTLEWDNPLNSKLGKPDPYERLDCGPFVNTSEMHFDNGDYYTPNVSSERNIDNPVSQNDDGVTYKCGGNGSGALLSIPHDGLSEDVIRTKVFEDYIRNHVDLWFEWSQKNKLDVDQMEDLILITGCTLVTSWAAVAFLGRTATAEICLTQLPDKSETSFRFTNTRGYLERHCSRFDPKNPNQNPDQCIFFRGFRAKRRPLFFPKRIRAAAEPLPDDPDSSREDEIQVTQVANALKDRDPLIGVLDYIAENCPEGTIAIAHDDDLQLVENVETLTADEVEKFLRENEVPVLVENGAAILNQHGDATSVPDEKKATFYATAELGGEPVPMIVHPVLTKYLLKLEVGDSVDPDYDLPGEELTSPAVHPPVPSLELENCEGYPQRINIQASGGSPDVGVTVQDVLRAIHEDLRKPSTRPAWDRLRNDERTWIKTSFKKRCKTEEELSKGLHRIDYLCGRDRLQIFPKLSPDGVQFSPPMPMSEDSPEESKVAGTSSQASGSTVFIEGAGR